MRKIPGSCEKFKHYVDDVKPQKHVYDCFKQFEH